MTSRKPTHPQPAHEAKEAPATPTAASPPPATAPATPAATPTPATPATPALVTSVANGSNHGTKVDLQAVYQALVSGMQTYYQPTDTFHMPDGTYTRDELITQLNGFVAAAQATKASNAQWRSDIQSERTVEQKAKVLRTALKGIVTARFGVGAAAILKFGFALPKPRKPSAETKAVAALKAQATREARGTKGSVEKRKVKGNVNVQLVVSSGSGGGPSQPTAGTAGASSGGASAGGTVTSVAAAVTPASAAASAAPASPAPASGSAVAATNGAAH
jgi:hypothetical protein